MKSTYQLLSTFSLAVLPVVSLAQDKLEEIVITASRTEVPLRQVGSAMSVVNKDEIRLRGLANLTDLLRNEAGISVTNAGGAGNQSTISIRGEEGYRTLVMMDGVELSDPTGTQVMTQVQYLATTGDIERIEILRGPQGFVYGADAGGVVQIFTKEASEGLEGGLSAEYGRYSSHNLNGYLAGGNEVASVLFSLSDQSTDGFNSRVDDATGETDGYDNTAAHFKATTQVNDDIELKLVYRDVEAENNFDNCSYFSVADGAFVSTNDCQGTYEQSIGRVSLNYQSGSNSQSLSYSLSDIDRGSFAAGNSTFSVSGDLEKVDYVGAYQLTDPLKFVYGADFKTETVEVEGASDLTRDQLGVFAELQGQSEEKLYLSGGFRYDDNEDFGEHISTRVSAAYIRNFENDITLKYRASYGNGFRAPSLSELAYNASPSAFGEAADTVLKEEKSAGFDLGLDVFFSDRASFGLTLFEQTVEDEIFFDLQSFSGYLQESGESESKGVEFEYSYAITGQVKLLGNILYNDTETSNDEPRSRKPEKLANIGLKGSFLEEKLSVLLNYRTVKDSKNFVYQFPVGLVPLDLDDYEVLDISVNYDISEQLAVFTRIENALDEEYQQVTSYNTARSASYVGVRYQF